MTSDLSTILQAINHNVDNALVNLAKHPEVRECFTMPSLVNKNDNRFSLSFHKFCTPVSTIRESAICTYLIYGMNDGLLTVNKEMLFEAAKAMRKLPIVEYYILGMYHELAARVYENEGNERKSHQHTVLRQIAHVKDYLLDLYYTDLMSPEDEERMESPRFRELLKSLNTDPLRFQSLLLYIIRYVTTMLKVKPTLFLRPQYLLVEEALNIAFEQFLSDECCDNLYDNRGESVCDDGGNSVCDAEIRSCFYYYRSLYYELTCRGELAERYKKGYLAIGGERDYENLCNTLLDKLPVLHCSEKEFVDYVMNFNIDNCDDLDWTFKDCELDDELPLTGFYRGKLINYDFNTKYVEAERGDEKAIREVARCFREGDGVTACEAAAQAWESKLM